MNVAEVVGVVVGGVTIATFVIIYIARPLKRLAGDVHLALELLLGEPEETDRAGQTVRDAIPSVPAQLAKIRESAEANQHNIAVVLARVDEARRLAAEAATRVAAVDDRVAHELTTHGAALEMLRDRLMGDIAGLRQQAAALTAENVYLRSVAHELGLPDPSDEQEP